LRESLEFSHLKSQVGISSFSRQSIGRRQLLLKIYNFLDLHEEPAVDFGEVEDFVHGEAGAGGTVIW
jgi:hypothetical protein